MAKGRLSIVAFCMAAAAWWPGPSTAAPGDPLGPAFTLVGGALAPVTTRAADGRFVVAYADEATATIRARRFAADGTPIGGVVVSTTRGQPRSIALDPAGGFAIAWDIFSNGTTTVGVLRFDASGQPIGAPIVVARSLGTLAPDVAAPAIGFADDGSFVVAWIRAGSMHFQQGIPITACGVSVTYYDTSIRFKRYDATGRALDVASGRIVTRRPGVDGVIGICVSQLIGMANIPGETTGMGPQIAVAPDGSFTIGWSASWTSYVLLTNQVSSSFNLQRYRANGQLIGRTGVDTAKNLNLANPRELANPAIARQGSGDLSVAWNVLQPNPSNGEGAIVRSRAYGMNGVATGDASTLATDLFSGITSDDLRPGLAASDHGAVAVWRQTEYSADFQSATQRIFAQRLDAICAPFGSPRFVTQ
jgi:hypothetical protein